MRGNCVAALAIALVGCATATRDGTFGNGNGTDSGTGVFDSSTEHQQPIDAPAKMIDGPPGMTDVTLTQTTGTTIAAASLACGACQDSSNPCDDYRTDENAYYRVFPLAAFNVTSTLHVTEVDFGVEEAGGTQSVQVKIGTYTGTPGTRLNTGATDFAGSVTPVNSVSPVTVPATTSGVGAMVKVPITGDIPAGPGANLIVEVFSPDHTAQTNTYFFLGASTAADTAPGYIRAPATGCAITSPETPVTAGQPADVPFIINVLGTY